ncbi:hypothetical protein ORI99_00025 [Alishewanella sp. SMS9]|nr:hypothetical protein [Alishewanella sp. SMS9]
MEKYNGSLIRKFPGNVSGNAYVGASITVYIAGTSGKAILYAANDVGGGQLANPLTSDDNGNYSFYAANGRYRLEFGTGQPDLEVLLLDGDITDAQEAAADAAASAAAAAISADAAEDAAAIAILYPEGQYAAYEALLAKIKSKATAIADFVRNEFKAWEAPYGQEPKQLTDVVTTIRASDGTVDTPFGLETRASNIARITYDHATGEPLGVLCEEARTNLLLHSQYTAASGETPPTGWTFGFTTGATVTQTSPRFAGAIRATQSGTAQREYYAQTVTLTTGLTYTLSCYFDGETSADGSVLFIAGLTASLSGTTSLGGSSVTGAGTYSITFTCTTGGTAQVRIGLGCTATATGIVTHETPQLEVGSLPTSYIPTTTAAVTRVKDQNVLTPTHNENEFTVYGEFLGAQLASSKRALSIGTSATNRMEIADTSLVTQINGDTVRGVALVGGFVATERYKVAYKFIDGIVTLAVNGAIIGSTAQSVNRTFASTNIKLSSNAADNQPSTITFAEADYYPRALSDAEMIALTQG